MKKLTIIVVIFLGSFSAFSQNVDYNSIILPSSATDISFDEKLVRLAWKNNPESNILLSEVNVATYEMKISRWEWLDQLKVTGNLNEFNIDPSSDTGGRSEFFPRYNVSAFFTIDNFVGDKMDTKLKKEKVQIAMEKINAKKLEIRSEVLTKYQTYLMNQELLKVETETTEDLFATLSITEQSYKNGQATLEEYNDVLDRYNAQRLNTIKAQTQLNISKIQLEELIGVRLEDVQ